MNTTTLYRIVTDEPIESGEVLLCQHKQIIENFGVRRVESTLIRLQEVLTPSTDADIEAEALRLFPVDIQDYEDGSFDINKSSREAYKLGRIAGAKGREATPEGKFMIECENYGEMQEFFEWRKGKGREIQAETGGLKLVSIERMRQIEKEGYDQHHDAGHGNFELSNAGCSYATSRYDYEEDYVDEFDDLESKMEKEQNAKTLSSLWPFDDESFKPERECHQNPTIKDLVRGASLIVAQIDLMLNENTPTEETKTQEPIRPTSMSGASGETQEAAEGVTKAEFAVQVLKEYAEDEHCSTRHTHDLSPLEEYLLVRLFTAQNTIDFNVKENMNLIRTLGKKIIDTPSATQLLHNLLAECDESDVNSIRDMINDFFERNPEQSTPSNRQVTEEAREAAANGFLNGWDARESNPGATEKVYSDRLREFLNADYGNSLPPSLPTTEQIQKEGQLYVWNGIEASLDEVDTIQDAKDYYKDYMENGDLHPDIESIIILREIGHIKIEETGETTIRDNEETPICATEIVITEPARQMSSPSERPLLKELVGKIEIEEKSVKTSQSFRNGLRFARLLATCLLQQTENKPHE